MWQQDYLAVGGSLWLSSLVAAMPILLLFYLLGVRRLAAWKSALAALAAALVIAPAAFGTPISIALASSLYGAAFGLFPIGWVVLTAIYLYRITVESGQFEIIKNSIAEITADQRLQVLLIAFAFGAFIEGAAGFGAPVAISGAMLAGFGFAPFYAAALCLLANTSPVAFGSIGTPIITLAGITELPLDRLSAMVGRMSPILSLIIPVYLVVVFAGWRKTIPVLPAIAAVGISFAVTQFLVSNFIGPYLTDILSSIASIAAMMVLLRFWHPSDDFSPANGYGRNFGSPDNPTQKGPIGEVQQYASAAILKAWTPYLLLVLLVLLWGFPPLLKQLENLTVRIEVPFLHNQVVRMPPVVKTASTYAAVFRFNWFSAAGTACLIAAIIGGLAIGLRPRDLFRIFVDTSRQMALAELTIASVLGFAFLMNYSGMTATLGLAFAATGWLFPFFSSYLGWLGVFITGSDTSSNALFGNLQVVTANALGLNPVLMAATNSTGGVMGKMISLQSIAVAVAATGMPQSDESGLFRWTIKHSILLAGVIGLIAMAFAHLFAQAIP